MRSLVGLLLIAAAVLKAVQLATDPTAALVDSLSRGLLPAQIGIELALGLIVLSGRYWHTLRWFVIVLFAAFAGYSLYLALSGAASCGCFGPIRIHPWWTFGLDLFVILGMLGSLLSTPNAATNESGAIPAPLMKHWPSRDPVLAVVASIIVLCTALFFHYGGQRTAIAGGLASLRTSVGDLLILEPEQWIGQKLPIADSIDVDLSQGEWVVLLHRHDCPVCQEQVPKYEQRAARGERVALVEVPPYGDFERQSNGCLYARLRETREWFVQTPVEIRLIDGVVTAVETHEHQAAKKF
jgi:hypothetical protein